MRILLLLLIVGTALFAVLSFPVPAAQGLPLVTPVPTNVDAEELVTNGGFESPGGWTLRGSGGRVCKTTCEYRFTDPARLTQKIAIDGAVGDRLVLSVFSRGRNWRHSSRLHLRGFHTDGTHFEIVMGLYKGEAMTRNEGQIIAQKPYSKIKVYVAAASLSGRLWVDDISVTRNIP